MTTLIVHPMAKRIGSRRRKTRYLFKLNVRERGKIGLSRYFAQLLEGDKVNLKINSNVKEGQFFSRFYGRTGTVTGVKKGTCYEIKIRDGNAEKTLFVHPIH